MQVIARFTIYLASTQGGQAIGMCSLAQFIKRSLRPDSSKLVPSPSHTRREAGEDRPRIEYRRADPGKSARVPETLWS